MKGWAWIRTSRGFGAGPWCGGPQKGEGLQPSLDSSKCHGKCVHLNTPLEFTPIGPTVSPHSPSSGRAVWGAPGPGSSGPGSGRAVALLGWDVKEAITLVFCKLLGSAVQLPLTQRPRDTHGHFGWML